MDADRIELVRGLFAAMTERAEELHGLAIAGQARFPSPASWWDLAHRVAAVTRAIEALAAAAAALTEVQDVEETEDLSPDDRASGDPGV